MGRFTSFQTARGGGIFSATETGKSKTCTLRKPSSENLNGISGCQHMLSGHIIWSARTSATAYTNSQSSIQKAKNLKTYAYRSQRSRAFMPAEKLSHSARVHHRDLHQL